MVFYIPFLSFLWVFVFEKNGNAKKYQRIRTLSVMFFQFVIAFMVPGILEAFHQKAFYFSYFWPLKIEYLFPSTLEALPRTMVIWAIMMAFVGVPVLTYFFGKRWYCSWVCGCGALANTLGDPWRHLSSKTRFSWRLEMMSVYSVLAIAIVMTGIVIYNHYRGDVQGIRDGFSEFAFQIQDWYGFLITAGFAGVVGTGFYPIGGTRVWCRFGCPQAAILGIIQKFFFTVPNHSQWRSMYVLWKLLYLLRNGNRRSFICHAGQRYFACLLCWLRNMYVSVSSRSTQT